MLTYTKKFIAVLAVASAGVVLPAVAQDRSALTRDQVVTIEKEVTGALQTYYRLYSERNDAALGPDVYFFPWINFGADGPKVNNADPEGSAKSFAANIKRLEAMNWDRTEYPDPVVCVINAGTALASGGFVRYAKDGSVLNRNPITYLFGKTPAGWRVVAFFGHEEGKIISCNDGV